MVGRYGSGITESRLARFGEEQFGPRHLRDKSVEPGHRQKQPLDDRLGARRTTGNEHVNGRMLAAPSPEA